jgi:hypothetical protein
VEKRVKAAGWKTENYGENLADEFLIDYDGDAALSTKEVDGQIVFYKETFFGLGTKEMSRHTYKSFARGVVKLWLDSERHKKNLLSKEYTHLGCGVHSPVYDKDTRQIPKAKVVQNFGGK